MVTHFLAFLGVSAAVIVTPGQDTALTIRNTLLGGRRNGVFTAVGVSAGQAVWALATSAGVAAVLQASEPAFVAVKLAGATYLVFLGLQTLVPAVRSKRSRVKASPRGRPLRQGLVSNLGNPKMAIFFTSLLPQFGESFATLLGHALLFSTMTLAWLALVVRVGDALRIPAVRRAVDAVTGIVLVAFGSRLAVGSHRA